MRPSLVLLGSILFAGITAEPPACAQDVTGDRVVVPARNTTRPRRVDASLTHGSITVKAYAGKEVIVETRGGNVAPSGNDRTADGLKRLSLPTRGLSVEEEDNVVTVRLRSSHGGDLVISVPADTSLKLHNMHGEINVEGVHGEIEVNSMHGPVTLTNVAGTVVAHSLNGAIKVSMDSVDPSKPMSFSTLNGSIDVTLPADFKANVKLSADRGEIYSDFDFKLAGNITQRNDTSDGRFRVHIDRTITGTVNGGGQEATFHTFNGTIYIRKKK